MLNIFRVMIPLFALQLHMETPFKTRDHTGKPCRTNNGKPVTTPKSLQLSRCNWERGIENEFTEKVSDLHKNTI